MFALVGNCARKMTFDNAFRYSLCCLPSISGMKLEGRKIGLEEYFRIFVERKISFSSLPSTVTSVSLDL